MKIKNIQVILAMNTLSSFASKRLPQKISYAIIKNDSILSKEYEVYARQLEKLILEYRDYAIQGDDGEYLTQPNGLPIIQEEFNEQFHSKVNELLNIEIEVDLYHIDESCFNYDDVKNRYDILSPVEIKQLSDILCKINK